MPQPFIPLLELATGDFSIFGSGIKAGVAELFLQKPQTITGIIDSHGMDGKGISQSVRADVVLLTSLRVNQSG